MWLFLSAVICLEKILISSNQALYYIARRDMGILVHPDIYIYICMNRGIDDEEEYVV